MEDKRFLRSRVIELSAYAFVKISAAVLEQLVAPDVAVWIGTCIAIGAKAIKLSRRSRRRGRHRRDRQ